MKLTDPFFLVPDLLMIPASELSPSRRDELGCAPDDVVLTRPASRTPSRIVTPDFAALLGRFTEPTTFVAALIDYCSEEGLVPNELLEPAFSAIVPFIRAGWLIQDGDAAAAATAYGYDVGDGFADFSIIDQVQALEDTEVYRAVDGDGVEVALKLARIPSTVDTQAQFENEASTLHDLPSWPTPRLLSHGVSAGVTYLATEWIHGTAIGLVARDLRATRDDVGLLRLARSAATSYARLHEAGIVHGDVYPRNVLVDGEGTVWLIDFGHGHRRGQARPDGWRRKGSPEFYDPQFAAALKSRTSPPEPSALSDQYALGAVLYSLFTGAHYIDAAPQADHMLTQLIRDKPVSFRRRGRIAWPELEATLARSLAKDPQDRFSSVNELARCLDPLHPPPRTATRGLYRRQGLEARELIDGLSPELFDTSSPYPRASVVHGMAGIAAAFLEVAVSSDNPRDLESADRWSQLAQLARHSPGAFTSTDLDLTVEGIGQNSVLYGAPGLDVVRGRVAQAMGNNHGLNEAISALIPLGKHTEKEELAMGTAGLLLSAALILDDRPDASVCDPTTLGAITSVRDFGDRILHELASSAGAHQHLGMAHGLAGTLYAALMWCEVTGVAPSSQFRDRLEQLASLGRSYGRGLRWPTQPPPAPTSYFESWCHGTPGHVLLWAAAARIVDDSYTTYAERAAITVAETEPPNSTLCCGATGRAYAFLAMYRSTGQTAWLDRAADQATFAWTHRNKGARDHSLFQGALGPAVLLLTIGEADRCTFPMLERWR